MERKTYSPDLEKEIREKIEQVEKRARARTVDRSHLERALAAMRETPHGTAFLDGGQVPNRYKYPAETTYVEIAWSTRRGEKWVAYSVRRDRAKHVPYGAGPSCVIEHDERQAYRAVFPERVRKRNRLCLVRFLARVGLDASAIGVNPERFEPVESETKDRIALVRDGREFLMVTPLGVFPGRGKPESIDGALRMIGLSRMIVTDREAFVRKVFAGTISLSAIPDENKIPAELRAEVEKRPYGMGVFLSQQNTFHPKAWFGLYVWYTRRGEKREVVGKSLFPAVIPTPETPRVVVLDDPKAAWETVFPDRAERLEDLLTRRRLRRAGIPDDRLPRRALELVALSPEYRMAIVRSVGAKYLVTPAGAREISSRKLSFREAFREAFGIPLPRKRELEWKDIEAQIALRALGGG